MSNFAEAQQITQVDWPFFAVLGKWLGWLGEHSDSVLHCFGLEVAVAVVPHYFVDAGGGNEKRLGDLL